MYIIKSKKASNRLCNS